LRRRQRINGQIHGQVGCDDHIVNERNGDSANDLALREIQIICYRTIIGTGHRRAVAGIGRHKDIARPVRIGPAGAAGADDGDDNIGAVLIGLIICR